jgi:hypothetical protein
MFSGFRDVDPSDQSSSSPGNSPGSSGGSSSSRAFGPAQGPAKARLQDKQIEKGRSIMMRDYVSILRFGHRGRHFYSSMTGTGADQTSSRCTIKPHTSLTS